MPGSLLEVPSNLTLKTGQSSRLRLGGAGPAGYDWVWATDGDATCISVSVEAAPADAPIARGEPQTSVIDQVVTITGKRAGAATLHLKLSRSFQPGKPPIASHDIAIVVTR
jgi:hypothetical protein